MTATNYMIFMDKFIAYSYSRIYHFHLQKSIFSIIEMMKINYVFISSCFCNLK